MFSYAIPVSSSTLRSQDSQIICGTPFTGKNMARLWFGDGRDSCIEKAYREAYG